MKKLKKIAALTLAAACAATVCAGAAFTDQSDIKVDSKVIDTLVEKNVIKGYENGSFQPNETVARGDGEDDLRSAHEWRHRRCDICRKNVYKF